MEELGIATNVMAKGKSFGPNGMVVEIYTFFGDLMGENYYQMINIVVELGHLTKRSGKAWSFFYLNQDIKGVSNQELETNLTFLNVTYKIYVKAL